MATNRRKNSDEKRTAQENEESCGHFSFWKFILQLCYSAFIGKVIGKRAVKGKQGNDTVDFSLLWGVYIYILYKFYIYNLYYYMLYIVK